jgi:3-phosphoshikimate 1-carboxyvinyltransferase
MRTIDKIRNKRLSLEAPPSKAYTLRALIIGSLAEGTTVIEKPLLGQDQLNVIRCLNALGIKIEQKPQQIIVHGSAGTYQPISDELNVGESGVGMNFLTSAACLADKPVVLTGVQRITERPIAEVVQALQQLGCEIEYLQNEGFPPVRIIPKGIQGGRCEMSGAINSQYFSSMAISAVYAKSPVTIVCVDELSEKPYLDITLQMMADFGIEVINDNYKHISIPQGKYHGRTVCIEGDYSSASYFFLAAAICGSKVIVSNMNPDTRQGDSQFIRLLEKMGCDAIRDNDKVAVQGKPLKAIEYDMSDMPDMVPSAAIACAFAEGVSRLTNIGHLRHKECDRLAVMASELQKMGVDAQCDETSLTIEGNREAHGAVIDPHNDHRIAMSFATGGLVTGSQQIENPGCVAKSFPDFWERFEIFHI